MLAMAIKVLQKHQGFQTIKNNLSISRWTLCDIWFGQWFGVAFHMLDSELQYEDCVCCVNNDRLLQWSGHSVSRCHSQSSYSLIMNNAPIKRSMLTCTELSYICTVCAIKWYHRGRNREKRRISYTFHMIFSHALVYGFQAQCLIELMNCLIWFSIWNR